MRPGFRYISKADSVGALCRPHNGQDTLDGLVSVVNPQGPRGGRADSPFNTPDHL